MRAAEQMLVALGIERPEQIDLEAIAWANGALVKYRPLDGSDALIVGGANRAIITVNSRSISRRRRFSIGHELGHWHHHRGRFLICSTSDIGNPTRSPLEPESQADQFASDLVLPNFMLKPRLTKMRRATLAAAREIADEFDASLTAVLLKLIESDQFPMIVVCHNKKGRRWFRSARMIPGRWFPNDDLDVESIAFDMLHGEAGEISSPRKIGADGWFSFRGSERFDIQEQSFRLPNDEVLTLLILPENALG